MRKTALLLLVPAALLFGWEDTALDRYVRAPDPSYKYELSATTQVGEVTAYLIDLTSQTWRTPAEVDRNVWHHWLTIFKPAKVDSATALLFISGGSINGPSPKPDASLSAMAAATNSVVVELRMIPNEPLTFLAEGKPRNEDGIIAYTWDKYLRTGDESWPLRLPMTKAAVRAMDTVTAFLAQDKTTVDHFVVAGASKRGWTTWTTAAVDKRVVAISPLVIDLLNLEKSFEHHYRAYGFWAPAIKDYEEMGIMNWMGTPQYHALMKIEEPYEYRDRLTMPKLVINDTGDQFFLPDSSQFYFDDLKGEKLLRYVPNTDHSLRDSDARETLIAYYDEILKGKPRPRYSWKFEANGDIRVTTKDKPLEVKLWQAVNPAARDFRLMTIGKAYTSTSLTEQKEGVYVGHVGKPEKGWTAYFVELTFPAIGSAKLKLTTGVRVAPDTLPFAPPKK